MDKMASKWDDVQHGTGDEFKFDSTARHIGKCKASKVLQFKSRIQKLGVELLAGYSNPGG